MWIPEHGSSTVAAAKFYFNLHAYCVMPDHVHFLVEGIAGDCNLVQLVEWFKQQTAYQFNKLHRRQLWQRRYYDHILRSGDPIEDIATHIWWNPVRKGICSEPHSYPLSGSRTIDWMKRSKVEAAWKPIGKER
jgi:putative transposase